MGKLQDANTAAVLSAGQSPAWAFQTSTGYPSTSTNGVNVSGSLRSLIEVHTSLTVGKRSALLIPSVFDAATAYNVIINGTTVGASGADVDAAMVALAIAVNANVTVNTIVVATAVDATLTAVPGLNTRLLVEGLSDVPYSFDVSATGAGTASGKADPITTDVYLYEYAGGSSPSGKWVGINSFSPVSVGPDGFAERLDTAGLARVAARMVYTGLYGDGAAISYDAQVYIGPTL